MVAADPALFCETGIATPAAAATAAAAAEDEAAAAATFEAAMLAGMGRIALGFDEGGEGVTVAAAVCGVAVMGTAFCDEEAEDAVPAPCCRPGTLLDI